MLILLMPRNDTSIAFSVQSVYLLGGSRKTEIFLRNLAAQATSLVYKDR